MNLDPVVLTIVTFFSTMIGGVVGLRYFERTRIVMAFAGGVLIAVPLFDLLPESIRLALANGVDFEYVMYIAALGFIFLLILERHLFTHSAPGSAGCDDRCRKVTGWAGATELSVHSYLDGFAIGIGFQVSSAVGVIIALAVIFHDFSDGLNTVTIMMRGGNSPKDSLKMLLLDASTPILGAVTTLFFIIPVEVLIFLVPFFAGGFLYLGATDLLPEGYRTNPNLKTLALALLGFLLIFIVTRLAGL